MLTGADERWSWTAIRRSVQVMKPCRYGNLTTNLKLPNVAIGLLFQGQAELAIRVCNN